MSVEDWSGEWVEELLDRLRADFEGFDVNQLSLSVPAPGYRRTIRRHEDDLVGARVRVANDDGHLLVVERDHGWGMPGGDVDATEPIARGARRRVRQETGVDCRVDGLVRATIAGVHNEDDPDAPPVYRLLTVLTATPEGGAPDTRAEWHPDPPDQLSFPF
jgi:ADP-ribose pyrophosphatase YjhB (NUDIX family)